MRITIRRVSVIFDTVFTDDNGAVTNPDSATLTISYPTENWPFDGGDRAQQTIAMTLDDEETGTWTGTWYSGVSNPGVILWETEATTGAVVSSQEDGFFRLRGNLANLTHVNA